MSDDKTDKSKKGAELGDKYGPGVKRDHTSPTSQDRQRPKKPEDQPDEAAEFERANQQDKGQGSGGNQQGKNTGSGEGDAKSQGG